MKISYNWLKEYVNTNLDATSISKLLTDGGLEVESIEEVETIKGGLKGLVIGQVISCEKHPNADKLSITQVNIGKDDFLPIVCGAPNVAKGQKVVVATVGTLLYKGEESFEISKSKIRGEVSEGMICAEDEIGLGTSHEGIMVLESDAIIGTLASEYFNIKNDYVLEIGITPNRADATSHIGVARDLIALLNFHKDSNLNLNKASTENFSVDNLNLPISVEVKSNIDCPRYSALTISNIEVKDSPEWLQERLNAIGVRTINNIVDITNFVLMETGQPLHAFDYDQIKTKKVIVQSLPNNTEFTSLDETKRILKEGDLMICDTDKPMCIGGIFGGLNSGVKESTKNIFLESAYFNPVTIRKTSKTHGLKTDASFRFERGADPNITIYALKRAALLIKELAGGTISSEIIDLYPEKINNWEIEVFYENIYKTTGHNIPKEAIHKIVTDLEMNIISINDDSIVLNIPTFKVDVLREIDVIEEILRIYGFNNIPISSGLKSSISYKKKPDNETIVNLISDLLVSKGYSEAMNNSLTKSEYYNDFDFNKNESVRILNPLSSELDVLRQHLIFGLLESVIRNYNHKNKNIKLFEFGKHYQTKSESIIEISKLVEKTHLGIIGIGDDIDENWNYKSKIVDYYSLKAIVHNIFERLGIKTNKFSIKEELASGIYSQSLIYQLGGKIIAEIGILKQSLSKQFDIPGIVSYADLHWQTIIDLTGVAKTNYSEISKYPIVRRDLALLLNKSITFAEVENQVIKSENKLIKSVNLFDVYEGKGIEHGKKSYAISIMLQDSEKTLTDNQIDKIMNKVKMNLERNLEAKLR
jgi:phenylalanyl-tRNA synthetase beta chain